MSKRKNNLGLPVLWFILPVLSMEKKKLPRLRNFFIIFLLSEGKCFIEGEANDATTMSSRSTFGVRDSCIPACLNGGTCVGNNLCQCPPSKFGYRCSYSGYELDSFDPINVDTFHKINMCSMFGPGNIITFDGLFYDFAGKCQYSMAILKEIDLQVLVRKNPNCTASDQYVYDYKLCITKVKILKLSESLCISISPYNVAVNDDVITLPYDMDGIMLTQVHPYVIFVFGDVMLRYDVEGGSVHLILSSNRYDDKVAGLCGNANGVRDDDLKSKQGLLLSGEAAGHVVGKTWIEEEKNEICLDTLLTKETAAECPTSEEVPQICNILLTVFSVCHHHINPKFFFYLCKADLCRCNYTAKQDCHCDVLTTYSRYCAAAGGTPPEWRTKAQCRASCPFGHHWRECGVESSPTCIMPRLLRNQKCFDRCQCPDGLLEHGTGCLSLERCPCMHRDVEYTRGQTATIYGCNECVCDSGKWECQSSMCPGTAFIQRYDHFKTFDGRFYTFTGDCQYVFAKDCANNSFSIYVENYQCVPHLRLGCIKSFTVKLNMNGKIQRVSFEQGVKIKINHYDVQLPYQSGNLHIYKKSSLYIQLFQESTGLNVVWNGYGSLYVTVVKEYKGKMCGLAGNFNGNAADDYKTQEGVTESTLQSFRNSWKLSDDCFDYDIELLDPCQVFNHKEPFAIEVCNLLYDVTFSDCHYKINPDPYYKTCVYEGCSCTLDSSLECMCEVFAAYAYLCAVKGIRLDWRSDRLCNVTCEGGQVYQACGDGCGRTCKSLSVPEHCTNGCVEGCNCPEGLFLNNFGVCVSVDHCSCYHLGTWYEPGQTLQVPSLICKCTKGRLVCEGEGTRPSTCLPGQVHYNCSAELGIGLQPTLGYECAKTCQNKHLPCPHNICVSGCYCPRGYVWHKNCIAPEDCPCYHNSNNYNNGEVIKIECNECICENSRWQCTNFLCDGECSVIGESHFITYDKRWFDFAGDCEYILTTDACGSKNASFKVTFKSNPCDALGHICNRVVTVILGNENMQQIVLRKGILPDVSILGEADGKHVLYWTFKRGFFIVLTTNIGLTVFWDQNTRIYIQIDSSYSGEVCGLCGNFDTDGNNDFMLRSREVVNDNVIFGNNWRLMESCPKSSFNTSKNFCDLYPSRKYWSVHRCRIIESDIFRECRVQLEHIKYMELCQSDTCTCEGGDECDCFCTAVAAFAHACSQKGVFVSWRTPEICPTMCEEYNTNDDCEWRYEECGTSCPNTCCFNNAYQTCPLPCLEGCHPTCKPSHVFSEQLETCIPEADCAICSSQESIFPSIPITPASTEPTTATQTIPRYNETQATKACPSSCLDSNNIATQVGQRWEVSDCVTMICSVAVEEWDCPTAEVLLNKSDLCFNLPDILCTEYEEIYEIKYQNSSNDPNPCCAEYGCKCNNALLNATCPQWYDRMNCTEYEHITTEKYYHDSSQCCPVFKCEKHPCLNPAGIPFSGIIYYEYDGLCCQKECIETGDPIRSTLECFDMTCELVCNDDGRYPIILNGTGDKTCCKAYECVCDERLCLEKQCQVGQTVKVVTVANEVDVCCDVFECESVECVYRGKTFMPNETWIDECYQYKCMYNTSEESYQDVLLGRIPCPDVETCPNELYVLVETSSSSDFCCSRYHCDCQYAYADGALRKVGYEFPNPDHPSCSVLQVVKFHEDSCPRVFEFPLISCPENPQCETCQSKVKLNDTECCTGRTTCVTRPCPATPKCGNDQKLVVELEDECCTTYKCLCQCNGLGTDLVTSFQCYEEVQFAGNCTYLVAKELHNGNYSVSVKQRYCREVFPERSISATQMCIEQLNVIYNNQFVEISGRDGLIALNEKPLSTYSEADFTIDVTKETADDKLYVTHVTLHIDAIDLTVTYSNPCILVNKESIGFFDLFVRPSNGGTVGICGNCSTGGHNESECSQFPPMNQSDFVTDTECKDECGLGSSCQEDRCASVPPCATCNDCYFFGHNNPCAVLKHPVFNKCHENVTFEKVAELCAKTLCFQTNDEPSIIKTQCSSCSSTFVQQHIASCQSKGICEDYMSVLNCSEDQNPCRGNQIRMNCIDGCLRERSCKDEMQTNFPTEGSCGVHYVERCACPDGFVFKDDNGITCINKTCCCKDPPTCPEYNLNFQAIMINTNECGCPVYADVCECIGCIYRGKQFKPNETWYDECARYTCQPNSTSNCYNVILIDDLGCEPPPTCSSDEVLIVVPSKPSNCCPTYICECNFAIVDGMKYEVGDIIPDPSDPVCGQLRFIRISIEDCPVTMPFRTYTCEEAPLCDPCFTKTFIREDICCGKIYECLPQPCTSESECRRSQKRVLVSSTDCCEEFQCFCECSGLGSAEMKSFDCERNLSLSSNSSYLLTKGINSDVYEIHGDNVFCKDLLPVGNFTANQICLKQVTIRYYSDVFLINSLNGWVFLNGETVHRLNRTDVSINKEEGIFHVSDLPTTQVTSVTLTLENLGLTIFYSNPQSRANTNSVGVFKIDLSSTVNIHGTEGACGNCSLEHFTNSRCTDVLLSSSEEFRKSGDFSLDCGSGETCEEKECAGLSPCVACYNCYFFGFEDPCMVLNNSIFERCQETTPLKELLSLCDRAHCFEKDEDPSILYAQCSACSSTFIQQHITSCLSRGICEDYLGNLGCKQDEIGCPGNLIHKMCIDTCTVQQTCGDAIGQIVRASGPCDVNYVDKCVCPDGYVLKEEDSHECVNKSCCCPRPPLCPEGSSFAPTQTGFDNCNCPVYTTSCQCSSYCILQETGQSILPGEVVESLDSCGEYLCPSHNVFSECKVLEPVYRRKKCNYNNTCAFPKIPVYLSKEDTCCPLLSCKCPEVETLVCSSPYEVIDYTNDGCAIPFCVCRCPPIETNCTSYPGCKVSVTASSSDNCNCPISWKCSPKSTGCPAQPLCSPCEELVKMERHSVVNGCTNNCTHFKCQPKMCRSYVEPPSVCPKHQRKVLRFESSDSENCCPIIQCECLPHSYLQVECPQYNFSCDGNFKRVRSNSFEDCCPEFSCECNILTCPPPTDCGALTLVTKLPNTFEKEDYKEACCPIYECTCDKASCSAEPLKCPENTELRELHDSSNPCCPKFLCVCSKDVPSDYNLPNIRPNSNNYCTLPGQNPIPSYDPSGCFPKCECYADDLVLDHCIEYQTTVKLCQSPRVVVNQTARSDEINYACCPKTKCVCPDCGPDYMSMETLLAGLQVAEIVVPRGPISECCQAYEVICDSNAELNTKCLKYKPLCEFGFKLQKSLSDIGCCPQYYCECDETVCDKPPQCKAPKILITSDIHSKCCETYRCACPQEKTANLICPSPTIIRHTLTECPQKYCGCPDNCSTVPLTTCLNKPGCKAIPVARDVCGCIVDITCVEDPSPCEELPRCPMCYSPVQIGIMPLVGECNSTCPKYECRRDPCPKSTSHPHLCPWNRLATNFSKPCCPFSYPVCVPLKCPTTDCGEGYAKTVSERQYIDKELGCPQGLFCCKKESCVCQVCKFRGRQYSVGETWVEATNCDAFTCTNKKAEDGCFKVKKTASSCELTGHNGTIFELVVGASILDKNDPCKSKRCELVKVDSVCFNNLVEKTESCPSKITCSEYEKLSVTLAANVCCPQQKCICKPCENNYHHLPLREKKGYEVLVNKTLSENPNQLCCPKSDYKCASVDVLMIVCAQWNKSCPVGRELKRMNSINECCPEYECTCKKCQVQPIVKINHPCLVEVNATGEDNPLQDCCPFTKLYCSDDLTCCGEDYISYRYLERNLELGEEIITLQSRHECCPLYKTVCIKEVEKSQLCSPYNVSCPVGYQRVRNVSDNGCCPVYNCICDLTLCPAPPSCTFPQLCMSKNLQAGCCKTFSCELPVKGKTEDLQIHDCFPSYFFPCNESSMNRTGEFDNSTLPVDKKQARETNLRKGSHLQTNQCLTCLSNGIVYLVGSSWIDDSDHCNVKECILNDGDNFPSIGTRRKYQCESFNKHDCIAYGGEVITNASTDGCCNACKSCDLIDNTSVVRLENFRPTVNCFSFEEINVPYCSGSCSTSSVYNLKMGVFHSICRCCSVEKSERRSFRFLCDDGTSDVVEIDFVTKCQCKITPCLVTP